MKLIRPIKKLFFLLSCGVATNIALANEDSIFCENINAEKIQCTVIKKIKVFDITLNNGECLSPHTWLEKLNATRRVWNAHASYFLPLEKDFRGTYQNGDRFYVLIEPHCNLHSFQILTDYGTLNFKTIDWGWLPAYRLEER